MGVFLRRSMAANSLVSGPICPKFKLIHNIMHVLVTSKYEKDRSNNNGDYVMTSIFLDAQGQLTPKSEVGSGPNSNSSKLLCISSLPASIKRIAP